MKTIVLKFAGPLQSWGTGSHFETRQTDFYPSKSATIGLIAASMGIIRDEDSKIKVLNALDFAVRVDQNGKLLKDYHIAQKYKNNGTFDRTYVTNRYYLEDAVFLVAISHEDKKLMKSISESLLSPYFQPFLGRRSLPLTYDFYLGDYDEDIITVLKNIEWQASDWYKKKGNNLLSIYADSWLLDSPLKQYRRDNVISFSQKHRRFSYRNEARIDFYIDDGQAQTEHDAFGALGG